METVETVDVVTVGGGPSGLTVSAEIAASGGTVLVLDKRTGSVPSRAGVLQPRVLELLDSRGLMERFTKRAQDWRPDYRIPGYIYAGLNGVRYDQLETRFPYALILPQSSTEELLEQWALEQGARIVKGASFVSYTGDGDGVEVRYTDVDGVDRTVRSRYLIGADGARSAVRTCARVPFEGRPTSMTAMVVDAELQFPWRASMMMRHNDKGWILTYPFGSEVTRFAIFSEERRSVPKDEPVTLEEVKNGIRDVFGEDFGIQRAHWMSRYGDAHRIVPRLRYDAMFLVGESARIHYPASGVGMNFCIQDAFNLGWKLGLVVTGRAPDALLNTYDTERLPVARRLLEDVDAQCAIQFNFSAEGQELKRFMESTLIPMDEVNRTLREQLAGFAASYALAGDAHPATGRRVGDVEGVDGADGSVTRFAKLVRPDRFVLICFDPAAPPAPAPAPADLPVAVLVADGAARSADLAGARAVLVRPDSYVAAAWDDEPDLAAVASAVDRALGNESALAGTGATR